MGPGTLYWLIFGAFGYVPNITPILPFRFAIVDGIRIIVIIVIFDYFSLINNYIFASILMFPLYIVQYFVQYFVEYVYYILTIISKYNVNNKIFLSYFDNILLQFLYSITFIKSILLTLHNGLNII